MGIKIASGKTKNVYETLDPSLVLIEFRDDITALDGRRRDLLEGKGSINAEVTSRLMSLLNSNGIPTHFVEFKPPSSILAKKLNMLPLEVVCRNISTGSLVKRLPFKEGETLNPPVVEFFLKDDARGDPMVNESHIAALKIASFKDVETMVETVLKVNEFLRNFLASRGMTLFDFKLEFGKLPEDMLIIGDELDLDCMRVRDVSSGRILDKDLYRRGLSLEEVLKAYLEFKRRIS